jgi:putative oxidoreductase
MIKELFRFVIDPGPSLKLPAIGRYGSVIILTWGRFWLGLPFLKAGLHRLGTWDAQSFLFSEIHPVPLLPAVIAAPLTTGAELVLGALLLLGLAGRLAAAGLGVMAASLFFVIGRTSQGIENGIAVAGEQIPWMIISIVLIVAGPGLLSLDAVIARRRQRVGKAG